MTTPSTIIVSRFPQDEINRLLSAADHQFSVNNPDLLIIDSQTGWGIEIIRSIRHFLSQKPISHSTLFVIIFDAQRLGTEAQNALLKTLEEPPPNCSLVLTTPQPSLLLPTILSRCHLLRPVNNVTPNPDPLLRPQKTVAQNLALSEELTVNKESVLPYLQNQLRLYQQQLVTSPSPTLAATITKLIKTIALINSNVDPRSALDYFLLS